MCVWEFFKYPLTDSYFFITAIMHAAAATDYYSFCFLNRIGGARLSAIMCVQCQDCFREESRSRLRTLEPDQIHSPEISENLNRKAALINILLSTTDQMMCNVKGAVHSDEPTENYHPTLLFHSALQCFSVFHAIALVLRQKLFSPKNWKTLKKKTKKQKTLYATCPAQNSRQTELVTNCGFKAFTVETTHERKRWRWLWIWISDEKLFHFLMK